MAQSTFKSSLTITHIGTATAVLEIDNVKLLTDPFFSPAGTEWAFGDVVLRNLDTPVMGLENLPPIDAVLLSHEDHPDNLDEVGRRLLDGRKVLTTVDGANKLKPRPGVRGLKPWETVELNAGGKVFQVTGTPCQHLPGGECTGFVLTTESFGVASNGLPNAIYISGDTIYFDELDKIADKWNVVVAILNLGKATVPSAYPDAITMDGKQGAELFRAIKAGKFVPMHFDSWEHFAQKGNEAKKAIAQEGLGDEVVWLTPGVPTKVL